MGCERCRMADALEGARESSADLRGGFGGQYFSMFQDEEKEKQEQAQEESDDAPQAPAFGGDEVSLGAPEVALRWEKYGGGKRARKKGGKAPPAEPEPVREERFPFDCELPHWDNSWWRGGGDEALRHVPVERLRLMRDEMGRLEAFIAARLQDRRVDIALERRILEAIEKLGAALRATGVATVYPAFDEALARLRDEGLGELAVLGELTLKAFLKGISASDYQRGACSMEADMGFISGSAGEYDPSGRIAMSLERIVAVLDELCRRAETFWRTGEPG